jgi:hypothetical protein
MWNIIDVNWKSWIRKLSMLIERSKSSKIRYQYQISIRYQISLSIFFNETMDIVNCLNATLSPDNTTRKAAENLLGSAETQPGFPSSLLQVLSTPTLGSNIHLAASLALKRCCMHYWDGYNSKDKVRLPSPYPAEEKLIVRNAIIDAACAPYLSIVNPVLRALADAFRFIFKHDYPDRWDNLPQQLLSHLASRDPQRTIVALALVRSAFYHYNFNCPECGPFSPPERLASAVMPAVQALASAIADGASNTIEAAKALVFALKSYRYLVHFNVAKISYVCREETIAAWSSICDKLLRKHLPAPGQPGEPSGCPVDLETRASWPWWKVKKWAVRIILIMSSIREDTGRGADDENMDDEGEQADGMVNTGSSSSGGAGARPERPVTRSLSLQQQQQQGDSLYPRLKGIVKLFKTTLAPRHAETVLGLLIGAFDTVDPAQRDANWLSPKVVLYALKFMQEAVNFSSVWVPVKPHLSRFICGVLMPILRVTRDEAREMDDDPVSWLQRDSDVFAQFHDPKQAADALIHYLSVKRSKSVNPILTDLMTSTFANYDQHPQGSPLRDYAGKEVVLRVLGLLNRVWRRQKTFKRHLDSLLTSHVFPELSSPHSFLKVRALTTISVFADSKSLSNSSKLRALEGVLLSLNDRSLPVRFSAAQALQSFLNGCPDVARPALMPHIVQIITTLFSMLDTLGLDTVIDTIKTIVSNFDDLVPQLAPPLTSKLSEVFLSMLKTVESLSADDDGNGGGGGEGEFGDLPGDDLELAAEAVLEVLQMLVELLTVQDRKDILEPFVLPQIWPVLYAVFNPESESLEFISQGCELFGACNEAMTVGVKKDEDGDVDEEEYERVLIRTPAAWAVFARALMTFEARAVDYAENIGMIAMTYLSVTSGTYFDVPPSLPSNDGKIVPDIPALVLKCAIAAESSGDDVARLHFVKCFILPLLHYGFGRIDRVAPEIAKVYAEAPINARTRRAQKASSLAIGICLCYSPYMALSALIHTTTSSSSSSSSTALTLFIDHCLILAGVATNEGEQHGRNNAKDDIDDDDEEEDENGDPIGSGSAVECKIVALGLSNLLKALAAQNQNNSTAPEIQLAMPQVPRGIAALLALLQRERMLIARFEGNANDEEDNDESGRKGGASNQHVDADADEEDDDEDDDEGSVDGDDDAYGAMDSFIDDDLDDNQQGINSPLDHVSLLLFAEEALRALGSSTFGASLQASLPPPIMSAIAEVFNSASSARQGGQVTGSLGPLRRLS